MTDSMPFFEDATRWAAEDPDPATRSEVETLLQARDAAAIRDRFRDRLRFGTAGIRGPLGAGPARMNRALVRRVTGGFAAYLLETVPDVRQRGIVVGRDARHGSAAFAEETRAVLNGAGIPVHWFPDPVPTPLCAYAVTALGSAGGVMITASHNPASDNGYKVYWSNGAQIIPPHDEGISREIDRIESLAEIAAEAPEAARSAGRLREIGPDLGRRYIEAVLDLCPHPEAPRDFGVVYTPMHGVGGVWVERAFREAGFDAWTPVPEQFEPDPDFPTVRFPNPEEPGALDLALALAGSRDAALLLANDPDADRLAVAVPGPEGAFVPLDGNEIGILLADYLLESGSGKDRLVMTTIVSSRLLSRMAEDRGVQYAEALTGFKWIANRSQTMHREQGTRFVFGFEEALGYTVGDLVGDKDGIGAALVLADLVAHARSEGRTVFDRLEAVYRRLGMHAHRQRSLTLPGEEGGRRIQALMDGFRSGPPTAIGGLAVTARWDLSKGTRTEVDPERVHPVDLPRSNVLVFELEGNSRVLVRPSGTEPKIKFYFEVARPMEAGESYSEAKQITEDRLSALIEDFWRGIERA